MSRSVAALLVSLALAGCGAHPRTGKGFRKSAEVCLGAGDLAGARRAIAEALRRRPRDAEAWSVRARIEQAAGHPGHAVVFADRAATLAPERRELGAPLAPLLFARGRTLAALGRSDSALRDYARAEQLAPALAPAIAQARRAAPPAMAAGGGETTEAIGADIRALALRDRALASQRVIDWAAERIAAAERGPVAIALLDEIGARDAALELAHRLVDEDPRHVPSRLALGRRYLSLARPERAEQEIDEAIWASQDRALTMEEAATLLEGNGLLRKACALRARALLFGVDATRMRSLGECLMRDGQAEQARAVLDRAASLEQEAQAAGPPKPGG